MLCVCEDKISLHLGGVKLYVTKREENVMEALLADENKVLPCLGCK
jgi:hypothetical protein